MGNRGGEQNPAYGLLRPISILPVGCAVYFGMAGRCFSWCLVKYDETWRLSVSATTSEYADLPIEMRGRVEELLRQVMACKGELTTIFDLLDGADICRLCRGECCKAGSFHFTVIDLLAYLATGRELFTPRFAVGSCPFLGDTGCMMEPEYRPYNCVTFVCDRIDICMDSNSRNRFAHLTDRLLGLNREIEALFGIRFMYGLLSNGERFLDGRSTGILRGENGNHK